jgi:hypothetical protein
MSSLLGLDSLLCSSFSLPCLCSCAYCTYRHMDKYINHHENFYSVQFEALHTSGQHGMGLLNWYFTRYTIVSWLTNTFALSFGVRATG